MNLVTLIFTFIETGCIPLLKKIIPHIRRSFLVLVSMHDVLKEVYDYLVNNCPAFVQAANKIVTEGTERALKFLKTVMNQIVMACREHQPLITKLTKLAAKAAIREGAIKLGTKAAVKYGTAKVASQSAKTLLKYSNPAGIVADVAQIGCEAAGYKKVGRRVGVYGNIGAGALTGAAIAGPMGAPIGALLGLGTWLIGEGIGQAVEYSLS